MGMIQGIDDYFTLMLYMQSTSHIKEPGQKVITLWHQMVYVLYCMDHSPDRHIGPPTCITPSPLHSLTPFGGRVGSGHCMAVGWFPVPVSQKVQQKAKPVKAFFRHRYQQLNRECLLGPA